MAVDSKAPIKNMADMEAWNPPDPHVPHRLAAMIERHSGSPTERLVKPQRFVGL